jgi:hypothetical protein
LAIKKDDAVTQAVDYQPQMRPNDVLGRHAIECGRSVVGAISEPTSFL